MRVWILMFTVLVLANGNLEGQTKEEFYNLRTLGAGKPDNTRVVAGYWTDFGIQQFEMLKYSTEAKYVEIVRELEPILAPIMELRQLDYETPSKEISEKLYALESDDRIAAAVFECFGPEYCGKVIRHRVNQDLIERKKNQVSKWFEFKSELLIDGFSDSLNLSEKQRSSIGSVLQGISKEYEVAGKKILEEISERSRKRWRELLGVLDSEQRSQAESCLGEPVEWHRDLHRKKVRSKLGEIAKFVSYVGGGERATQCPIPGSIDDKFAKLKVMSKDELDELGIIRMEPLVQAMFLNSEVWNALELIDEQESQIKSLKKNLDDDGFVTMEDGRFMKLLEGEATLPEKVTEVLLPMQSRNFLQIELQLRTDEKFDSTAGLLDPRVVNFLDLDKRQKVK